LADRFGLRSTAAIELTPTYPATVEAHIDNLDLQQLPIDLQTPLTGRLSANATSSLQLTQPKLARVAARIDAFEGSWNQQRFRAAGTSRHRVGRSTDHDRYGSRWLRKTRP
jgi:hypothetical protein